MFSEICSLPISQRAEICFVQLFKKKIGDEGVEVLAIQKCYSHLNLENTFNCEILVFICTNVVAILMAKQIIYAFPKGW